MIKVVLFDFGGVLAEEGFREGLKAIGRKNSLDPEDFFVKTSELIYTTGYVLGTANESDYWDALKQETGISGHTDEFRNEILKRFVLRPEVLQYVEKTKTAGYTTAILSDQTNWLDELNQNYPFFHHFDYIFNSFRLNKGKRDSSIFIDVCNAMDVKPEEVLFIDDNLGNIKRAQEKGLKVLHFTDIKRSLKEIDTFIKKNL